MSGQRRFRLGSRLDIKGAEIMGEERPYSLMLQCDICQNDNNFKLFTCICCRVDFRKTEIASGFVLDRDKYEADLKKRMEKEFGK